jgi:hypothetical protein
VENHAKVAATVAAVGECWTDDELLLHVCEQLDGLEVPVPKSWARRADVKAHTWLRALSNNRNRVVQAIKDHCKAAPNPNQLPLPLETL